MCLLPVFFMVSDLGGGASGGQTSFWQEVVLVNVETAVMFALSSTELLFAALPVVCFPRKDILWLELRYAFCPQVFTLLTSAQICWRVICKTHTWTGMVSHGSSANPLAQPDAKVVQRLTGSRWVSSHRFPLLSLEEATLM